MKKKFKQGRNGWLFSGCIWSFIFLAKLIDEGLTFYTIISGITGVLSLTNAYIHHKEIVKGNED
ncbi:hypothetical protein [Tissierella praeacuta]|uniref:hypothetical protein n=1 Tax=Tissierella praeacuta TaxID=43131 RepID=UPI0033404415